MRIAAVDIGTNTVRLLLAEAFGADAGATLANVQRYEVITKLGEGLDASGRLSEEPMARALAGLSHYAALIAEFGAVRIGGVATAATRSAENGAEFTALIEQSLGFRPRVIDGVEEARLTFLGATAELHTNDVYCVIDVGGGSTEFVLGRELPEYAVSIDIGSVRLTERMTGLGFVEAAAIRSHVDELFDEVVAPIAPSVVLGSGGTFVTLAAVARGVPSTEIEVDGSLVLTFEELVGTVDRLLGMSIDQIAGLPGVAPGRAGVLQAGAICAERALAHLGSIEVRISVRDILDGLALGLAAEQWPGA
jgi:exopolyphosphatase/guanosine-5'-triphosphate,3'-diphosphate pyrophosphatase